MQHCHLHDLYSYFKRGPAKSSPHLGSTCHYPDDLSLFVLPLSFPQLAPAQITLKERLPAVFCHAGHSFKLHLPRQRLHVRLRDAGSACAGEGSLAGSDEEKCLKGQHIEDGVDRLCFRDICNYCSNDDAPFRL